MLNYLKKLVPYLGQEKPETANAVVGGGNFSSFLINPARPFFSRMMVKAMLDDPHIKFGLYNIRGPVLSGSRFLIQADNPEVKQFLISQITRFWRDSARYALRSLDFGWHGSEVMYRHMNGKLHFNCLKDLSPENVRPVIMDDALVGIEADIRGKDPVFLAPPKCFWTVHARQRHRWWGQSRLFGAHIPWFEFNAPEGFRDSRRLYYYKNAFDGGVIRYPQGETQLADGSRLDNSQVAQRLMDMHRNGSGLTLPNSEGMTNGWDYERPQSSDLSTTFETYGASLKNEMWEAIGVPPEIGEASGTGAYAGRQIPQEAFYALLQEIVQDIISDFDTQVLRPLVLLNFGEGIEYEIECFGLIRSLEDDRGNHKDDARQPLGVRDGGDQTEDAHLTDRDAQLNMSEVNVCPTQEEFKGMKPLWHTTIAK